jgi:hypothetical protein
MKQRLSKEYGGYGQRWQIETVNSMIKRRLAAHVAAPHLLVSVTRIDVAYHHSQHHDSFVDLQVFYRAFLTPFFPSKVPKQGPKMG